MTAPDSGAAGAEENAAQPGAAADGAAPTGGAAEPDGVPPVDPAEQQLTNAAQSAGDPQLGRLAQQRRHTVRDADQITDIHDSDIGTINQFFAAGAARLLVAGPLSAEELRRREQLYCEIPGRAGLAADLEARRLVVLCGAAGTGRFSTAVALLDGVSTKGVSQLDPETDLAQLVADQLTEGVGYVVEPAQRTDRTPLSGVHLDRLAALLGDRGAYGVVLLPSEGAEATDALRGRYGRRCAAPDWRAVLRKQLRHQLGTDAEADRAIALAEEADLDTVLGLGELRPAEAVVLAGMLRDEIARRERLDATQPAGYGELAASCASIVRRQVADWFRAIDWRAGEGAALAAVRLAAFRIALAVYDNAPIGVVVEAAEQLAWELAIAADPERLPPRPLFAGDLETTVAASRAFLEAGTERVGHADVPVRRVRFCGSKLASAVLVQVWTVHHDVRPVLTRWLSGLAREKRPEMQVPAAAACGLLASRDFGYGLVELVGPLATDRDPRARQAAAIALDSAYESQAVRAAVVDTVKTWSTSGDRQLTWTAAYTYGLGNVGETVASALRALARIGTTDDEELFAIAGEAAVQLVGSEEPETALHAMWEWLGDERRQRVNLGLLATVFLASARTADMRPTSWMSDDGATAGSAWPLALTLAEVDEQWAQMTADLIYQAVETPRSRELALAAVGRWLRDSRTNERMQAALARFLPQLVDGPRDVDRIRRIIRRQMTEPDDPLPRAIAHRMAQALREAAA